MMLQRVRWKRTAVFLLMALGGFCLVRAFQERPSDTSHLATGLSLPAPLPELGEANGLFPAEGCIVVVFFSESCAHCRAAAVLQASDRLRTPTVWVGRVPGDRSLANSIHRSAELIVAPTLSNAFLVRGVPAAFAVRNRVVLEAWILEERRLHTSIEECIDQGGYR